MQIKRAREASTRTFRRSTFAACTPTIRSGLAPSRIYRRSRAGRNLILKFADRGVKRDCESAFPADQIGPLEFYAETMTFSGYFECIRSERDDVVAPVDLQDTL
jgi:hypothetical protein